MTQEYDKHNRAEKTVVVFPGSTTVEACADLNTIASVSFAFIQSQTEPSSSSSSSSLRAAGAAGFTVHDNHQQSADTAATPSKFWVVCDWEPWFTSLQPRPSSGANTVGKLLVYDGSDFLAGQSKRKWRPAIYRFHLEFTAITEANVVIARMD